MFYTVLVISIWLAIQNILVMQFSCLQQRALIEQQELRRVQKEQQERERLRLENEKRREREEEEALEKARWGARYTFHFVMLWNLFSQCSSLAVLYCLRAEKLLRSSNSSNNSHDRRMQRHRHPQRVLTPASKSQINQLLNVSDNGFVSRNAVAGKQ